MLLNAGKLNVEKLISGDAAGKPAVKIVIGTSNTAATPDDTTITGQVVRDVDTVTYPSPGVVKLSATFLEDDPSMTVREVGLLNEDNVLVHRKVVNDTMKSPGVALIVGYRIKVQ